MRRPALRIGGTLAAAGLLAWLLDPAQVAARLAGADAGWLVLAVALLIAQVALSAERWRHTAAPLGLALGRTEALGEYYLAVLANTLLPGGVLGDVARGARDRQPAGAGAAALSVVLERAAGQVALGVAGAGAAMVWLWPDPGAAIMAGLVLATGAGGWALARGGRAGAAVRRAWIVQGAWRAQVLLSLAVLACNIGGFWAAAQAVGVDLPWPAGVTLVAAALTAMLLPVSLGGWGLREGAAAAIWPLAGIAPEAAVAAALAYGIAALLAATPGLLPLGRMRRRPGGA
jgi:glycosyltransferase 2 family protein